MNLTVGTKVEATANGAKGVIIALTAETLRVKYAGIGERNVPLDKADTWLRQTVTAQRIHVPRAKTVPVFLAQAQGIDAISSFVSYLQRSKYRLYLSCKPDLVEQGENEYSTWTGGDSLPEDAVRVYEKAFSREWFLTFEYSPDVQYPVSVIERGTGGGQGEPVILHKNGRCELCYWQVIEQLVRAGLRA
jgi:hypothetical protein